MDAERVGVGLKIQRHSPDVEVLEAKCTRSERVTSLSDLKTIAKGMCWPRSKNTKASPSTVLKADIRFSRWNTN